MIKNYFFVLALTFFVAINLQAQTFVEKAIDVGIDFQPWDPMIMAGGAAVLDYNNDGWEDVYITGGMQSVDKLYRNNGNGTFTDIYVSAGMSKLPNSGTLGAAAGDLNNDGWTDIVVSTSGGFPIQIFRNNGNGTFSDVTEDAGIKDKQLNTGVSLGDFNNDGLLDIYVNNHVTNDIENPCGANNLYVNLGKMKFTDVGPKYQVAYDGCSLASTFSDIDNDGDLDLFSGTDFSAQTSKTNKLWKNMLPEDAFVDISSSAKVDEAFFGMGVYGADYDADGDYDYYMTNIGRNRLYRNDLSAIDTSFTDVATLAGVDNTFVPGTEVESVTWGINWSDFDNDGDFDLFVSAGFVDMKQSTIAGEVPNRLFSNNGNGTFDDHSISSGTNNTLKGRGSVAFDYDKDGDLDLIQVVVWGMNGQQNFDKGTERVLFYENTSPPKNYIKVKLDGTRSGRDAFGATVKVYAGGKTMMQYVDGGGASYLSQNSPIQHFGLGSLTKVDSIAVIWPGKNDRQSVVNPNINSLINIVQAYKTTVNTNVCYGTEFMGKTLRKDTVMFVKYTASYKSADSLVTYNVKVTPENKVELSKNVCEGTSFMGEIIEASGIITKVFQSYAGCDSTVIANVTLVPPSLKSIDTVMCYGSKYRGLSYFKDTTLTFKYLNYNGCDSTFIANVVVTPAAHYEEDKTICFAESFMGEKYYSSQVLTYNFASSAGCDSIYKVNLTVLPAVNHQIVVEIPKGSEYDGKVYNTNATVVKTLAGAASNGCDSVLTIKILVSGTSVERDVKYYDYGLVATPNPISHSSIFSFVLNSPAEVSLRLFDLNGEEVATIKQGMLETGSHQFNFDPNSLAMPLSQGTYLLKLEVDNTVQTHKVQILK